MRWILVVSAFFLYHSTFAADLPLTCPQALPTNDPNFCASFKSVAICHCMDSGLPASQCKSMDKIYRLMIDRFGSIQKACAWQHHTTTQICIDDWECFRSGGLDSQGRQCSDTGKACNN